jgi:hypothetical protein
METKDQKVIKDLLQIKSSFLVVEELNGSVCHIWKNKKSQRHREEGPAFASRGDEQWWRYGEIHREDGPALSLKGSHYFFINGVMFKNQKSWTRWKKISKRFNFKIKPTNIINFLVKII